MVFAPYSMIYFVVYEKLKRLFAFKKNGESSIYGIFACAVVSSSISASLTSPLDVIKTRVCLSSLFSAKIFTEIPFF